MKILVFSDTHGRINKAIDIINSHTGVDMIIHLGDLVKDAQDLEDIFDIDIRYIAGNNDYYIDALHESIIDICGKKLFVTHGHKHRVKYGLDDLIGYTSNLNIDAVLFGHTHTSFEQYIGSTLYLNPGSLALPREAPSYGIIEIKDSKIYSMICIPK